jgi:hypothetical protein
MDHACLPVSVAMRALEVVPPGAKFRLSWKKCRGGTFRTFVRYATNSAARRWCLVRGIAFPGDQTAAPQPEPVYVGVDPAVPGTDRTVYHDVAPIDHKARASGERDD